MKIFGKNNEVLDEIVLCLTQEEVRELAGSVVSLAKNPDIHHHHVSSGDFKTEVTLSVYTINNVHEFHPDLMKILKDDLGAD